MSSNKLFYLLLLFFLTVILCSPLSVTVQVGFFRCIDLQPCFAFEIAQNDNFSDLNSGYEKEKKSTEKPVQSEKPEKEENTKSVPFKKFSPTKKIPAEQAVDFPVDI